MALANTAACVKWEDNEICALIVGFYKKHGHDLNKLHPRKMAVTIQKARDFAAKQEIDDYVENVAPVQGTKYEKIVDPDGSKAKQATCNMLKIDILKLVQFKQENTSTYRMYLDDAVKTKLEFKGPEELLSKTKFGLILFERTGKSLSVTAPEWKLCKKNFEKFIEVVAAGPTTTEERMALWLERYLQEKEPIDIIASLEDNEPFVHQGHWWVYPAKWKNWVIQNVGENKTESKLELDLTVINAERIRFTKTRVSDGARKTIRPYKIPVDVVYPPPRIVKDSDQENFDFPPKEDFEEQEQKADIFNFPKTKGTMK